MTEEPLSNIIMDTGGWTCKIGLSVDELPRSLAHTTFFPDPDDPTNILLGQEAFSKVPFDKLGYLVQNGNVPNWTNMQAFWEQTFRTYLGINSPQLNLPVLTNCYPNSNKYTKERQTQMFFENFEVPQYFSVSNSLLTLYSSGRVHGLVVDSGHMVTSVVPISEGVAQYYNQTTTNFGGKDITNYIFNQIRSNTSVCVDIKEHRCRVSQDPEKEITETVTGTNKVPLPDGTSVDIGNCDVKAAEGLFNPNLIGVQSAGIPDLILNSLSKCELEARRDLLSALIIVGGNTEFQNFNERLDMELSMRIPTTTKLKLHHMSKSTDAQWIGGALISRLDSFAPLWVTRADYDEQGPSVIHRKCI